MPDTDPFAELEQAHSAPASGPPTSIDPFAEIESQHAAPLSMLTRIGKGVLRGAGLPDSGAPDENTQTMLDIHKAIHENRYGDATKLAAGYLTPKLLLGPAEGLAKGAVDQGQKVYKALKEGRYFDASKHAAATLLPPLGPAADASEYREKTGDTAGGVAQEVTSLGAGLLGLKGVERGVTEPEAGATPIVPEVSPAEANFRSASKPLVEVFGPRQAGAFQENTLRRGMPIIQQTAKELGVGKIDSLDKLDALQQKAYQSHTARYKADYLDPAVARGSVADTSNVADAMTAAIPEQLKFESPSMYQELKAEADIYRTKLPVGKLDEFRTTNNAKIDALMNKSADSRNTALRASATKAMLDAQTKAYRDSLYKAIDPESDGANVRELQQRVGSLKDLGDNISALKDRTLRDTQPGAVSKIISKGLDLPHMLTSPMTYAAKQLLKESTINQKISQAFGNYKGEGLPELPARYPVTPTSRQLGPGPIRGGAADPSKVTVTHGAPLDLPMTLKKTGPNTFSWQRNLFPDAPERPISPTP